ncbi:M48 family metallopeptidase [Thalassotalea sp. LPB0316]|uniref:M48 family metallopeptidase n=1 Tax=Thalassotalea sp. LPB0316 TaxID=2769490 RepID=UPI0018690380|nr:M48 family metallopeptidase [Thalassotalea sp. LPB0316]QOL25725.1 M48 family metallopeptidase [Thalassotalea sp. LPB0316]
MVNTATYYVTGSSSSLPVTVNILSPDLLQVIENDSKTVLRRLSRSELKVSSKLGEMPREVLLPDNGSLYIDANASIDQWLFADNNIGKLESNSKIVLLSLLLVPLFLFSIFKYLLPAFAVQFADLVPSYVTQISSTNTLNALDKTVLAPSELDEETIENYVVQLAQLTGKLNIADKLFKFQFRKSEFFGANAFALPDGTIVITDDLVALLDNNFELLAAIVLHEIGHVERNHSMRLIAETIIASMAIDYFIGDLGGMIEVFAGISNTIVQNQYSQKLEWEADNYALEHAKLVGLTNEDFAVAMEKFATLAADGNKLDALFSSHPLTLERIENARNSQF